MSTASCPICGTWFTSSSERDHHLVEEDPPAISHQIGPGPSEGPSAALFSDRHDAGRRLSRRLDLIHLPDPVVIGVPRGGVPVAYEVATGLDAPLDIVVVSRLIAPSEPERGLGMIAEGGVQVVDRDAVRTAGIAERELAAVSEREQDLLRRKVRTFRGDRPLMPLTGRTVIVVDDGILTGSTALAVCQFVRGLGANRIVLAVPVAAAGLPRRLAGPGGADAVVCLKTPERLSAIGQQYKSFEPVEDHDVVVLLGRAGARPSSSVSG